jgi:hypothetical protein
MSKQLEKAMEAERKAADKRAAIERHERLITLSLQQTKLLRAKDYAAAEGANVEINMILQGVDIDVAQNESE